jgi:hypothetical protein
VQQKNQTKPNKVQKEIKASKPRSLPNTNCKNTNKNGTLPIKTSHVFSFKITSFPYGSLRQSA